MSLYREYDEQYSLPAVGFTNSGSICWFNSMLQMLLSLPAFVIIMLKNAERLKYNKLACAVIELIHMLQQLKSSTTDTAPLCTQISKQSSVICRIFRTKNAKEHGHILVGNGQECASEGYVLFLEQLSCQDLDQSFTVAYDVLIKCPTPGCNKEITKELRERRRNIQSFIVYRPPVDITDAATFAMQLLLTRNVCENYVCESCNTKSQGTMRDDVLKYAGEIIVVLLHKFYIKKNTWFPDTFTLPKSGGGVFHYKRIATVHHNGTAESGHYYTNCIRDGLVVKLNDIVESTGSLEPRLDTFMVAYHMITPDT